MAKTHSPVAGNAGSFLGGQGGLRATRSQGSPHARGGEMASVSSGRNLGELERARERNAALC